MATSSGGGKDGNIAAAAPALFNLPPDDDSDGGDSQGGDHESAENEETRQYINDTLTDVFQKNLHICYDENIQDTWVSKRPKIVFNYLFGCELGNGSYGKVKEVLHFKTTVRRAVKIIKDKKVGKIPNGISNVQREISILKQLDHPNVIRLIESFRVERKAKLYLIFEFCVASVDSLLETTELKRMNEYQAHYYFSQLVLGLEYLHSIGVIHKDIKPTNLLINEEDVLKIADFGNNEKLNLGVAEKLSNLFDDTCATSQGTPAFQAPEVVMGENPTFSGKLLDIWASGVSLFRMTTGIYPFEGSVLMKLFENIANDDFVIPEKVTLSKELLELINGMLTKNPKNRWTLKEIKESKWITTFHPVDNENLLSLPELDNTFFEEMLLKIEQDPEDVDYVIDAIPFNGTYPSSVIDRTLQTPAFSNIEGRTVNLSDDPPLEPIRLEFEHLPDGQVSFNEVPANSPFVITNSNSPLGISSSASTTNSTNNLASNNNKKTPRRPHRKGIFSCFRATDNSPE